MAFKDLFPAEVETRIKAHSGKWFVRTMDGSGVLTADGSYAIIPLSGTVPPLSSLVYFDKEVLAVVGAWNYYHHHQEHFPDDQRQRWNKLYILHHGQNLAATADSIDGAVDDKFNNVIQSEPMEF